MGSIPTSGTTRHLILTDTPTCSPQDGLFLPQTHYRNPGIVAACPPERSPPVPRQRGGGEVAPKGSHGEGCRVPGGNEYALVADKPGVRGYAPVLTEPPLGVGGILMNPVYGVGGSLDGGA